jgi:hypothetical protein
MGAYCKGLYWRMDGSQLGACACGFSDWRDLIIIPRHALAFRYLCVVLIKYNDNDLWT